MKALVGAFNQEKALVGAFSVIIQQVVEPMDRFAALVTMSLLCPGICHNSTQCVLIHETISGRSDGVKSSVFTVSGFITNSLKLKGNKGGGYEKLLLMID